MLVNKFYFTRLSPLFLYSFEVTQFILYYGFSIIAGIIISVTGIGFAESFIKLMLIPEDIFHMSLRYLRVYFAGTVFVFSFNISSGILRALGDSKKPFYYLIFSSLLNIILDLLFVAVFSWSVEGAASATIISQGLAMISVLKNIKRKGYSFKPTGSIKSLNRALKLGLPMAIQSMLFSVANLFMQRGINSFGTAYIGGWSICGKSDFIIWSLADTSGVAVTTFVAQNFGSKNRARMIQSVRVGMLTSAISVGIISAILYIFIEPIAQLFIEEETAVRSAVYLMRLISPFYFIYAFGEVFSAGIKGRGNTLYPMMITLIGTCIFRILWVQVVSAEFMSIKNVISGYPWSWFATTFIMMIYYFVTVYLGKNKDM